MSEELEQHAYDFVKRVGGQAAAKEFDKFLLQGYLGPMASAASAYVREPEHVGSKRNRQQVEAVITRKAVWKRYVSNSPELSKVAVRLRCIHPTSCPTKEELIIVGTDICHKS